MDRVRPSKNIPEIAKSTKSARDSSTFDIPLLSPLRVMELIPSLRLSLSRSPKSKGHEGRGGGGLEYEGGGKGYEASAYSYFRAQFHGQYREIYRAAVCDDILRVEAGGWRGPTHGGALDVTPYVWPPCKRDGGRRRRRRRASETCAITSLLFRYLYQVRPLLSAT